MLHTVHLESNAITRVGDNTFGGFIRVRYLSLQNNPLRSLPRNAFWGMVALDQLDLSRCSLTKLEDGTFRDQASLTYLVMNGNKQLNAVCIVPCRIDLSIRILECLPFAPQHARVCTCICACACACVCACVCTCEHMCTPVFHATAV